MKRKSRTEIDPQSRPRQGRRFRKRLEFHHQQGHRRNNRLRRGFPRRCKPEAEVWWRQEVTRVAWQPVEYPVEVGISFAAQAENGSPAQAGNNAGRQAAGVEFEQSWRFITGASQGWNSDGVRKPHRQLSSRWSDQLRAMITSTASVEDAVAGRN